MAAYSGLLSLTIPFTHHPAISAAKQKAGDRSPALVNRFLASRPSLTDFPLTGFQLTAFSYPLTVFR